ncbi:MAG: leucine--tRNA ligase [Clostridia bacterium]|nr:leucine--tRNA ligase [Clostridia bacterium]
MAYSVEIDRKWQEYWEQSGLNHFNSERLDKKLYVLEMFSYPSGANLHVGHWYNYALSDSWARMKKMQGYEVFQPMGFDAFGLPAENYAIKTGIHPLDSTHNNIRTMEKQLREMGGMFDWDAELATCEPDYYRWNQWLFLQLYKNGLAYRKNAPVNWCPNCNTVLANEQVDEGACERCGTEVTRKNLTQWFFRITAYAQELLDCLPTLDWPEKTKKIQTNWIGRSEGAELVFGAETNGQPTMDHEGTPVQLKVFTTRADTVMGVTYVVVAPESELCGLLTTEEHRAAVEAYIAETRKVSDIDRMSTVREKTGVFTGSYAVHPITGAKVPIWAADYVIAGYGTGVVMAVPAHDERDFEFAQKFTLPILRVIQSADGTPDELPFCEKGLLVNSGEFDGLDFKAAVHAIISRLEPSNQGSLKINYRLRDWLVSRQRYWGTPIPVVHCPTCGVVPVPEDQLPVQLPYDVEFRPDGESPLKKCRSFIETTCPTCGGPAERDPDTLDTFVCSSWYQFRYVDNKNDHAPFAKDKVDAMCPVDKYIGGAEHAAMHLLYARFVTKALRDMGYLSFDEPFRSLVHQGTILGADGQKMSKSRGNTISPDDYIVRHGSDVFRMYLGFGFAYTDGGPWNDDGVKAIVKYVNRVDRLVEEAKSWPAPTVAATLDNDGKDLQFARHYAIKSVSIDAERFQFNTSISRMMELMNAINKYQGIVSADLALLRSVTEDLLRLMAPFAPHFCEESWHQLGYADSIFRQGWPTFDPQALVRDTIEIAVQTNGAVKFRLDIPSGATAEQVEAIVKSDDRTKALLDGKQLMKFIYVKGRLANLVVR